jgi:hypothetical protein
MFRLRLILAALPACVLLACHPAVQKASVKAPPLHPTVVTHPGLQEAKAQVLANLKDPDSARFEGLREVHLTSGGKGSTIDVVCGSVNAKNSMGGYVGFLPFAYLKDVKDHAPTDNNIVDHFFSGRVLITDTDTDSGDDDYNVMGRWHREDVAHLCGPQTQFADDDELLGTALRNAELEQDARRQAALTYRRKDESPDVSPRQSEER